MEQARAGGKFTPIHDAWWAAARKAHGYQAGTRAFIEVVLLHRRMRLEQVVAGLAAALSAGALTSDAVALEARKADTAPPADAHSVTDFDASVEQQGVISLTAQQDDSPCAIVAATQPFRQLRRVPLVITRGLIPRAKWRAGPA